MKTVIAIAAVLTATATAAIAAPDDSTKCLRRWDNTNPEFDAAVKAKLHATSFKDRGTTTRTMPNGQVLAKLAYTADGKQGTALGRLDAKTCNPISVQIN